MCFNENPEALEVSVPQKGLLLARTNPVLQRDLILGLVEFRMDQGSRLMSQCLAGRGALPWRDKTERCQVQLGSGASCCHKRISGEWREVHFES